jgi:hypothetical protein
VGPRSTETPECAGSPLFSCSETSK